MSTPKRRLTPAELAELDEQLFDLTYTDDDFDPGIDGEVGHIFAERGNDLVVIYARDRCFDVYLDEPFSTDGDWQNLLDDILSQRDIKRLDDYTDYGIGVGTTVE